MADAGCIEEISDKITPRTEAAKTKVDHKLSLTEAINKYTAIVNAMEQEVVNRVSSRLLNSISEGRKFW